MSDWDNSAQRKDMLEEIITLRAAFLIDRALTGLRLDLDEALDILRNFNGLTTRKEQLQREILVAAVENLIDFAVHEEYAMMKELPEHPGEADRETCEEICEKYNRVYAGSENEQVRFAASIAAWWLSVDENTIVTYMTQGDERVRAWHLSLEGLSYPKREFPAELIPPIEWGCRCFLVADGFASVHAEAKAKKRPPLHADPVFRESLAVGGKIFSSAHRYFREELPFELKEVARSLKSKFGLDA